MTPESEFLRISFNNEDNFVTNEATILIGNPTDIDGDGDIGNVVPPVTPSASGRPAVLTLEQVKMHLRIEPDVTDEDAYLTAMEMAARLYTENVVRQTFDDTVGEHVKMAMLLLIGLWYRNREAVTGEFKMIQLPLGYEALLSAERAYPTGIY